jgi:hypothetical protein
MNILKRNARFRMMKSPAKYDQNESLNLLIPKMPAKAKLVKIPKNKMVEKISKSRYSKSIRALKSSKRNLNSKPENIKSVRVSKKTCRKKNILNGLIINPLNIGYTDHLRNKITPKDRLMLDNLDTSQTFVSDWVTIEWWFENELEDFEGHWE